MRGRLLIELGERTRIINRKEIFIRIRIRFRRIEDSQTNNNISMRRWITIKKGRNSGMD